MKTGKREHFQRVLIKANAVEHDLSAVITSLMVEELRSSPASLELLLNDSHRVYSHALQEGLEVEVELGTVDDHSLIFRGRIYKVESSFPQQGLPTLRLLAHDHSMAMGLRRRRYPWTGLKLSELVGEIGRRYFLPNNLRIDIDTDPLFEGNGVRQQNQTDLEFLRTLASRYGCEMFVQSSEQGDELHFKAQRGLLDQPPGQTFYYGRSGASDILLSFDADSSVAGIELPCALSSLRAQDAQSSHTAENDSASTDLADDAFFEQNLLPFRQQYPARAKGLQQLIAAAPLARSQLEQELGELEHEAVPTFATEQELQARNANRFNTRRNGMRAEGTTLGDHRIHAPSTVGIGNVGGRFSGSWYLTSVRHGLDEQGYLTRFSCER